MVEVWKDISGYDGLYKVSNLGNVLSQKHWNGRGDILLKPSISHKGYPVVFLSKNSITKTFTVHRLVACAFIDNPNNYPQVNHKNEIKTDNRVENLEWCSASYNMNYGSRAQRQIEKVSRPVRCIETGTVYPSSKIAADANPPARQGNIILCCQGKNKSAAGLHWEYA